MSEPLVPAVVLAGGKTTPEFAAAAGVSTEPGARFLAEIHGQPMIRYVLQALQRSTRIGRVVLVAPSGFPPQPDADLQLEANRDLPGNIAAALEQLTEAEFALLVTADLPFLTPEAVDDHVRSCLAADLDCAYAAIPETACQKQFPGTKRTYLHTLHGAYTGGNVVLQRISAFEREAEMVREAYLRRKNPAFLTRLIGWKNMAKFVTRRLTLEDIGASTSRLMGVRCGIVVSPWAELGTDVDKPDDLVLARRLLQPP